MMPFPTGKGDLEHLNDVFQTHRSKIKHQFSRVQNARFFEFLLEGPRVLYAQHAFSLEVLGLPPSFTGWFPSFTIIWEYHHPKKSLPFFYNGDFHRLPGFFPCFFLFELSIVQDDRDYLVSMGITTHEEILRGEGNSEGGWQKVFLGDSLSVPHSNPWYICLDLPKSQP